MGRFKLCAQWAVLVFVGAVLSGCTLSDALNQDPIYSAQTNGMATTQKVDVAIVTDRNFGTADQLGFDNHWSETAHCASASVIVPAPRTNDPATSVRAEPPPAKVECDEANSFGGFTGTIHSANANAPCGSESVLLYVHGYNTTFRSALLRTGQMAADADWHCAAATFSWGSEGQFDRYAADIERSGYAVPLLMQVLKGSNDAKIATNIVAHSMGNRVTLSALAGLSDLCAPDHKLVNELILAAPDVGDENFNDDFAALLSKAQPCARRITIYASRNDMVLMLSDSLHGGIPRAGLDPQHDRTDTQDFHVDVIDATDAPGDPLGHGYFVSSYEMLDDIAKVLHGDAIASRTGERGTLRCENPDNKPCAALGDRYALSVKQWRGLSWTTRLERNILAFFLAIQYGVPGQLTP
jgi:esterase/lipase superfamily enzyme